MDIFHSGLYLSWNGFLHHQFTEYNAVCSDTHSPLVCMSRCIICILICLSDHLTFCVQYNTGVKKCSFYDIRTPAVYTGNVSDHRTDPVLMRLLCYTIPLVVMFRYIPTLRIEYRQIRSTMDIRGISDTVWKRVCHPLATIEYILIPLLMRCLKVTDELAASGTTRGLELECKRYALRPIRFAWPEIVVSLLGILFLVGLLFIDQTQIGKIILWRV